MISKDTKRLLLLEYGEQGIKGVLSTAKKPRSSRTYTFENISGLTVNRRNLPGYSLKEEKITSYGVNKEGGQGSLWANSQNILIVFKMISSGPIKVGGGSNLRLPH